MNVIFEGKAKLKIELCCKISKDMPVFYNPVMELNRTIAILLLNSIQKENMQIALPLAGTGIRGIRFLLELKKGKIKKIYFNDYNKKAVANIKKNLILNKIKLKKISIFNQDANLFLLKSAGFDYIDIDPFGSPNPFLDSAVKRISRNGVLAITATDTSALCGSHAKACQRKYWAMPLRNESMHEIGLRILIRKCQLIGAQYDKALIPIYSYSKDHYMRVFFICQKGKAFVDSLLKQHGMFMSAGPLWRGALWDEKLAERIAVNYRKDFREKINYQHLKFLGIIREESKIPIIGFYNIPKFAKKNKIKKIPKQELIISEVMKKGYKASKTHFSENALRSTIPEEELKKIIKKL